MNDFNKNSQQIYELIKNSNPIIIHRHINPDGDALGSQWGLKHIIDDNFANKKVLVPGETNDHMRPFFPEPTNVTIDDYKNALVIVCDTANAPRISGELWKTGKSIIKIDHHPIVDDYAQLSLIEITAAAACQVIAKWAKIMALKVSVLAAKYLFLGLVTDSGRFLYRSVNAETFEVASFLVAKNFNLLDLYQNLYAQNLKIARIKGYILCNFKISANGVAYIIFNDKIISDLQNTINSQNQGLNIKTVVVITEDDLTSQVNVMGNIVGIKIWLVAAPNNIERVIKISARSTRWIINDTIAKYGGGGHQTAAGVRLQNINDVMLLINDLDQVASKPQPLKSN